MEFTLTKEQQAVAQCTAKEESRPVLTNVCLRNGELIAADGFILARTKVSGDVATESDVLIPGKDMLRAKVGKTPLRISGNGNGKVEIYDKDGAIVCQIQPGNFPSNIDQLYPNGEPVFSTRMSKELLTKILKMMAGDSDCVDFTFYTETSPIAYSIFNRYHSIKDAPISGIVMPMVRK